MRGIEHIGREARARLRAHRRFGPSTRFTLQLALLLLVLGCAGGPAPESLAERQASKQGYSLVIDAGSQGSRLRVYQWNWETGAALPTIHTAPWPRAADQSEWSARAEPGLSAFADDPAGAGESLGPLIDLALSSLGPTTRGTDDRLPPVLVLATGGMRRLDEGPQEAILAAVRSYLRERGFDRIEAHVVSGRHEALFGWLGGNYILGRLTGPRPGSTQGASTQEASTQATSTRDAPITLGGLDLGGASAQIAFAVEPASESLEVGADSVEELRLGDLDLRVFVRSDSGFGQDVAEETLAGPACFPPGFTAPSGPGHGDYQACRDDLTTIFRNCRGESCPPSPDEFPTFPDRFVAVSNYFYTSLMFQLPAPLSLAELESVAGTYCATPWATLLERYPQVPEKYLGKFCFSAAYIVTLLTEGYGFPYATGSITPLDRLGGEKIAWTVGALLYDLTRPPPVGRP